MKLISTESFIGYVPDTQPVRTEMDNLQEMVDQGLGFWGDDGDFCLNIVNQVLSKPMIDTMSEDIRL